MHMYMVGNSIHNQYTHILRIASKKDRQFNEEFTINPGFWWLELLSSIDRVKWHFVLNRVLSCHQDAYVQRNNRW